MTEDLDAIHLRACGCDDWKPDPDEPVRSLMDHVVEPLLARVGSPDRDLCEMHGPHPHGGGHCLGCPACRGGFRFCIEGRCTKQAGHHDEHGQGR